MIAPEKNFIALLNALGPMETPLSEFLLESLRVFEYPRGHVLKAAEEPCKYVWYLYKGAAKMYRFGDKANEEIVWLWAADELVYVPGALYLQTKIDFPILITENALAVRCPISHLHYAGQLFPSFVAISHKLIETYILKLMLHLHLVQHANPQARYGELLQQRPQLIQQFKLATLASFLGISLSTLKHLRY